VNDTPAEREAENIWTTLRRRKVVQWTVAYSAGGWVLLQVRGFAADTYGSPTIVAQLAMLGLALCLPARLAARPKDAPLELMDAR
jgi:hypothetical protein